MSDRPRCIVLLSGGLDSATCLAIAKAEGFEPLAISFGYGQRHEIELDAARDVARTVGASEHKIVEIDLRAFGGSALTDEIEIPKDRDPADVADIPITYVPARNTIFLSYALAFAEVRQARAIYIGANTVDYSGYPDCRPEYIEAFETLATLATKAGVEGSPVKIHAPLMHLTKEQIIRRGLELGVDYGLTRSCYDPDDTGRACGHCDSCKLRLAAFQQIEMADPAPYQAGAIEL